jgi:flagellar basal body rod protein FlgC
MELTEPIESINRQLADLFGRDTVTGLPIWRVVWSEDQYEKQWDEHLQEDGVSKRWEVKEVKKYDYITEKYVLEQLVLVPDIQQEQVLGKKISYEPMYPFENNEGEYVAPRIDMCQLVINSVNAARGKQYYRKYVDELTKNPIEAVKKRVDALYRDLWGNETDVTDALAYKEGIVVPTNYTKNQEE